MIQRTLGLQKSVSESQIKIRFLNSQKCMVWAKKTDLGQKIKFSHVIRVIFACYSGNKPIHALISLYALLSHPMSGGVKNLFLG